MDIKTKRVLMVSLILFVFSTIFFFIVKPSFALSDNWIDERSLGEICINHTIPITKLSAENEADDLIESNNSKDNDDDKGTEKTKKDNNENESKLEKSLLGDPLVIIYHTHSSESYRPYTASNYHREEVNGTVREVGNVLESELEKKGINVIHDLTVHDRPSYNESYDRSLSTIQTLAKKYPTAKYIIDLHRDAAPSSAKEGKYLTIDNEKVAKFSMVVGQANENYSQLYGFAKKVSQKAEGMYPGFGGAIIQQNYFYNEFISDKALLLEVGNNKNTIEEAKACGVYFADVLGEIIMEEQ